ncbi:MNNG and nitrosoguanidine resistance protein [Whalleya microplaca]|nr:MNNG and nitrosoguanidine resistance protein [Whalleya microplaca]
MPQQKAHIPGASENTLNAHDSDQSREYREYVRPFDSYEQPHRSVGFWDSRLKKVRGEVALLWARTLILLVVFIIGVLSLYWAVLYHIPQNLRSLVVHVVDFDGQMAPYNNVTPLVGPTVTRIAQQIFDSPSQSVGYTVVPPSQFNYDPIAVRQAVYDWHSYAAIIVNSNATALLQEAVVIGNASYDPTGAIQFIIQSARQESTYYTYIVPQLESLARQFAAEFGPSWSQSVLNNDSLSRELLARAPAAVNPGISPLQIDLRPFAPAAATPAVSIGLIYLIIVAFFSFAFFLPIHMKFIIPAGHPPLHFWQLIIWRWASTVALYLCISLTYSFVSLAFQIPFWPEPGPTTDVAFNATAYGRGSFVVYWMVNYVGMIALGLACENMAMIIGHPWTSAWLIFWVITNVSTSFYSLDLAPGFFKWGYAWPLYHVVMASRQIVFDLHSKIGLNFGVLFTWAAVNSAFFPFCCYFMRWKTEREKRNAEKAADSYTIKTTEGEKKFPKQAGTKPPIRNRGFMRGV